MNNALTRYTQNDDDCPMSRHPRKKRCTKTQKKATRKAVKQARRKNR